MLTGALGSPQSSRGFWGLLCVCQGLLPTFSAGSGAIVAAIVVVVVIIVTLVLILLKMYNRRMRTRRELEPKSPKPPVPPALDPNSNGSQQPAAVTSDPADVPVETR
uniref:Noncompact myelin associated protein n=1 Tax=Rattus norvegicus TaxID=10116 RepID=A0ABK0LK10_RAT